MSALDRIDGFETDEAAPGHLGRRVTSLEAQLESAHRAGEQSRRSCRLWMRDALSRVRERDRALADALALRRRLEDCERELSAVWEHHGEQCEQLRAEGARLAGEVERLRSRSGARHALEVQAVAAELAAALQHCVEGVSPTGRFAEAMRPLLARYENLGARSPATNTMAEEVEK